MIFPDTALKLLAEGGGSPEARLLACGIIESRIESLEEALAGRVAELEAAHDGWAAAEARVAALEGILDKLRGLDPDLVDMVEDAYQAALAAEKGDDHE